MTGILKCSSKSSAGGFLLFALFCLVMFQFKSPILFIYTKSSTKSLKIVRLININELKETPGYLGCYLLTREEISYHNTARKEVETPYDCITYCQSTSHMYSYYKAGTKLCACDNLFYTGGLSTLPCGSSKSQSADVYITGNITRTKYSVLNRNWRQGECNCVDSLCSTLNCSNSKQICYVGPKAEFLQEVKTSKCNHTAVEPFYHWKTRTRYCTKSMHGFLPARCESWNKQRQNLYEMRFYRLQTNIKHGNVMIPLTPLTNQQKVLLVTFWRSGSTFLSEFFKGYPNSYYMFEPLYGLVSNEIHSAHEGNITHHINKRSMELLDRSFRCEFDVISGSELEFPNSRLDQFFKACRIKEKTSRLSCIQSHYSSCLSSDMIAIKTIRARLDWTWQLLEGAHQDLKIVYMVRDPRGILNSRRGVAGGLPKSLRSRSAALCDAIARDYTTAKLLRKSKYRDQVLVIRYEDIVTDNIEAAKYIYKSISIGEVPNSLVSHIHGLTSTGKERTYTTRRKDSLETAYKWKQTMEYETVKIIDSECENVYKMLGYLTIDNEQMLRNKSAFHIKLGYNILP